jgi:hypothetical protein
MILQEAIRPMSRTSISLDPEQIAALKRLAAADQASVAEIVRRAVDAYLASRDQSCSAWGERFNTLVSRVQRRLPSDVTSDEIEADITAARAEVRRGRRGGRMGTPGARRR